MDKSKYKLKISLFDKEESMGSYIEEISCNPYLDFPIEQDNVCDYFYKIEIIPMTDDEYNNLPEFTGF